MQHSSQLEPVRHAQRGSIPEFANILIVDDQEFDRLRLRNLCKKLPFSARFDEAGSLAVLRQRLLQGRYDLILLDYHLPDGTGMQALDAIRSSRSNADVAVVFITGTEHGQITQYAQEAGCAGCLGKDGLNEGLLTRTALEALQISQPPHAHVEMGRSAKPHSARSTAGDMKPLVSRMMRQMRALRDTSHLDAQDVQLRILGVEHSLTTLWTLMTDMEEWAEGNRHSAGLPTSPSVSGTRGSCGLPASSLNARVPTLDPSRQEDAQTSKRPTVFRRRPD